MEKGLEAGYYRGSALTRLVANRRRHDSLTPSLPSLEGRMGAVLARAVIVPDVSFYQDDNRTARGIDFEQMRTVGARGVIIRAGQGKWQDEDFFTNWRNAKAAGLPRGAYWYYDPRVAPTEQADRFADLLRGDLPELDAWNDAEFPFSWGGAWSHWTHLQEFMERLKVNLPRTHKTIYTGYYWWHENVWRWSNAAQLAYWKQFALNIAWYTDNPEVVKIPQPWTAARWWQFTGSANGPIWGAESAKIDLNYFNGDLETYQQTFGLESPTLPPGGTMHGKVTANVLNARNGGGSAYQDIGDLLLDDHLEASEILGGWWHLKDARRGSFDGAAVRLADGRSVAERAAATNDVWCNGAYVTPVTPPPPAGGSETVIKLTYDANAALTGVNVDGEQWVKP